MANYKFISADSHVQEPNSLYEDRVPAEYRHRTPHVEERNGATYLVREGKRDRRLDLAASRITEEDMDREFRRDQSGGRDISIRLSDQERDGIRGEVIYPNHGLSLFSSPDPGYQMAVAKAYNDWMIELFGPHPDRFAPAAIVPVADVPAAVDEVRRVHKMGYRVISVPVAMNDQPYILPLYEPLWSAVEDAGLVLSLHTLTGSEDIYPDNMGEESIGGFLSYMVLGMAQGQSPVCMLISSGVLERHPGLNFTVVESGAGWLAWVLYALDEQAAKKHMWTRPILELNPSEYFKRQGHVTFSDDPPALRLRDITGDETLLWGSDYPHDEGTFPHSHEVVDRIFEGVPEDATRKILYENSANLYGFPSS